MKCTVVVLVSLCAFLVTGVRSAPQRAIDFLPGDEEVQAVVKPIAGDSDSPDQQRQQGPAENDDTDETQQREQPEVPATVDPVENEQQTEGPTEGPDVTYLPEYEPFDDPSDDQFPDEKEEEYEDEEEPNVQVTHQPEEAVQNSTSTNDAPSPAASDDATTASPKDATTAKPNDSDVVVDLSSEERLTTDPIVVEESGSTESTEDPNRFAEDVNSLADDSANLVKFGADDSQDQTEPQARPTPAPKLTPKTPVANVPQPSTKLPPATTAAPASEDYDSKSLESNEDDDQVQLKVGPNDQFRPLPSWYSPTRLADFDQWQQQGSGFPQRSNWQPRHYQPNSFDGFHGHGFHRGSWH